VLLFGLSALEDDLRERGISAVGDGQGDILDLEAVGKFPCRTAKLQRWLAAPEAHNLDVHPAHPASPACSQRLHRCFLGGKPPRVALESVAVALAIVDLLRREHALEKGLAVSLDRCSHAVHFSDVNAQSDDHALPRPLQQRLHGMIRGSLGRTVSPRFRGLMRRRGIITPVCSPKRYVARVFRRGESRP